MKIKDQIESGIQALKANVLNTRVPLSVYLNVTYRCPNACVYCNYPNLTKGKDKELTTEQTLTLIDEMAEAGTKKLQITGGEPFLRQDLGAIVSHAKQRGIFVGISASGPYIAKRVDEVKDVDIIFISLDGPEEVHDSIRGKGSYSRATEAIDALQEAGIKVWTTMVVNKRNRDSIDYVIEHAKDKNLAANFVLFYYVPDSEEDHLSPNNMIKDLALSNEENIEVVKYLIERKRAKDPIGSSFSYFDYLLKWGDLGVMHKDETISKVKCWAGKLFCHIDPTGMLYPCGTSHWRVPGHSVVEHGFKEAFELSEKIPCTSCIMACHLEHNLLFSLNMSSAFNWLKTLRTMG